jgi:hypothetical protein
MVITKVRSLRYVTKQRLQRLELRIKVTQIGRAVIIFQGFETLTQSKNRKCYSSARRAASQGAGHVLKATLRPFAFAAGNQLQRWG